MTREFLKNIKSENRLDKIRLIMKNDDVIGGQPTDDEKFTSNTPFLDIACTMKFAIDATTTAQKTADEAKTAASNADKKAAGAQTAANTADGKAVAAQKSADEAKTAASNADKKAAGAQTAAISAQTKANQVPNPVKDNFIVGNDEKGYKLMTAEQVKALLAVPKQVNVVNEVGQSATDAISQKAFTDLSFGIGQIFKDVTSQRVKNTTYTNNSGKLIFVVVQTSTGESLGFTSCGVRVSSEHSTHRATFPVPPGEKYSVNNTFSFWGELME